MAVGALRVYHDFPFPPAPGAGALYFDLRDGEVCIFTGGGGKCILRSYSFSPDFLPRKIERLVRSEGWAWFC